MKSLAKFRSSSCPRTIALALIALGAAGCSAESTRFGESPNGAHGEVTGSVASSGAAPVGRVDSKPLPPASPPPQAPAHVSAAPAPSPVVAGGGRGMASYSPQGYEAPPPVSYSSSNPPPAPVAYSAPPTQPAYTPASYTPQYAQEATGTVPPRKSSGQWSWDGGTAITVTQGETVEGISHRHGVPVAIIMEANNLASPNAIQPGQRLVIPRYNPPLAPPQVQASAAPTAPSSMAPVKPAPAPAAPATTAAHATPQVPQSAEVHVVAPGDTLSKIARTYGKSVHEIAKANNIQPDSRLSVGDRITIPGFVPGTHVGASKTDEPVVAAAKPATNKVAASAAPTQNVSVATPSNETPATETTANAGNKGTADASPGFRWPAHGRVIAGFGPKSNGQQNDGIDVAMPENTPIKAAEDGVVAYAGNELKGYGNLILVKHPNGYVTAYAHAKELLVKRGDQIKRGEVIAKSGQTGNVEVPELHFEVRKGSAPVDPMQFLNGA
jgi:murein DD-endopeptidase MepM/ murein hydrolase activator NlpD